MLGDACKGHACKGYCREFRAPVQDVRVYGTTATGRRRFLGRSTICQNQIDTNRRFKTVSVRRPCGWMAKPLAR